MNSRNMEEELNERIKWMQMLELQDDDEARKSDKRSKSIEEPVCPISLQNRILSIGEEN